MKRSEKQKLKSEISFLHQPKHPDKPKKMEAQDPLLEISGDAIEKLSSSQLQTRKANSSIKSRPVSAHANMKQPITQTSSFRETAPKGLRPKSAKSVMMRTAHATANSTVAKAKGKTKPSTANQQAIRAKSTECDVRSSTNDILLRIEEQLKQLQTKSLTDKATLRKISALELQLHNITEQATNKSQKQAENNDQTAPNSVMGESLTLPRKQPVVKIPVVDAVHSAIQGNIRPQPHKSDYSIDIPTPERTKQLHRSAASQSHINMGIVNMSMTKESILKKTRQQSHHHRQHIRHLESEIERLRHKDPLRTCMIEESEILFCQEDLIGSGAFSQVYHGMYQGSDVAVKQLKIPLSSQDKNYFTAEVSLLRELRHPHVVLLVGVCLSSHLPIMVLEYMQRGSLYKYLHDPNSPSLDHSSYYKIAREVAIGMNYLHLRRPPILHLDLKSMNVLLNEHLHAKIADFGFSKLKHEATEKQAMEQGGIRGTPAWMAPELIVGGEISVKTDVYSFSIILWEMYCRQKPYAGCSVFQVLERVRKNKRPEMTSDWPTSLQELIIKCWDKNPAVRPQFKDILVELDELHLPQNWRRLFSLAGVPPAALNDFASTRNLISLVTQNIDSQHLEENNDPTMQQDALSEEEARKLHQRAPDSNTAATEQNTNTGTGPILSMSEMMTLKENLTKKKSAASNTSTSIPPPPPALPPPLPPPPPVGASDAKHRASTRSQHSQGLLAELQATGQKRLKNHTQVHAQNDQLSAPTTAGGKLTVTDSELSRQKQALRSTQHPHPSQLQCLDTLTEEELHSISHVLRKAIEDRRVAFDTIDSTADRETYEDSGWSDMQACN